MRSPPLVLAALFWLFAGLAAAAPASGPLEPGELFTGRRLAAEVSPSGRYIALVQRVGDKDRLVVIDRQSRTRTELHNEPDMDIVTIGRVDWKGEDRLVFVQSGLRIRHTEAGEVKVRERLGSKLAVASFWEHEMIYSVARTGGPAVRMPGQGDTLRLSILDPLDRDDDHLLLLYGQAASFGPDLSEVRRYEIATGRFEVLERGEKRTMGWETDRQGRVILRYDVYGRRGGLRVMGRDEGQTGWRELFSIRERDVPAMPDLEILGATDKPGTLYVAVQPQDRAKGDTRELRLYDFASKTMGEKLWAHPKYDLDSIIQYENGALAAMCYWADTYRCDYVDPKRGREAAAVDGFFDGQRNIRLVSQSRDGEVQVLRVSGPDEPGTLYLYDRAVGKIEVLGQLWPRLTPDRLGVMTPWRWSSRDGVELGGYLTAPPPSRTAAGALPLIVLPHGGPEVRDQLELDRWAQAFATRGYLVFQPNFRGSGGFGAAFAEQGYGQWGLRMQDDVIDGVEALVKSGRADPARICIVGSSYGGYVALQGGATRPDLFKCVVSRAGVSDLVRSQVWEKSTFEADSPRYKYWLKSVGDPKTDEARLKAASPITYAATYGPPVLLIHGENDWTVPPEQSRLMEKALKRAGRPVIYEEYKGQGHGGWSDTLEVRSLTQILAFVDQHIGKPK